MSCVCSVWTNVHMLIMININAKVRYLSYWSSRLPAGLQGNIVFQEFQNHVTYAGLILGLRSTNERRRYFVTTYLIVDWA